MVSTPTRRCIWPYRVHAIEDLFQELKGMNFHLGVEGISFFLLPTAGKTDLSRLPAGTPSNILIYRHSFAPSTLGNFRPQFLPL